MGLRALWIGSLAMIAAAAFPFHAGAWGATEEVEIRATLLQADRAPRAEAGAVPFNFAVTTTTTLVPLEAGDVVPLINFQ